VGRHTNRYAAPLRISWGAKRGPGEGTPRSVVIQRGWMPVARHPAPLAIGGLERQAARIESMLPRVDEATIRRVVPGMTRSAPPSYCQPEGSSVEYAPWAASQVMT